jgi:hypothetical protein
MLFRFDFDDQLDLIALKGYVAQYLSHHYTDLCFIIYTRKSLIAADITGGRDMKEFNLDIGLYDLIRDADGMVKKQMPANVQEDPRYKNNEDLDCWFRGNAAKLENPKLENISKTLCTVIELVHRIEQLESFV